MGEIHTVEGKKQFVEALTERVKADLFRDIEKVPDEWDGHHLRVMLAALFQQETGFDGCKRAKREIRKSMVTDSFSGYYK